MEDHPEMTRTRRFRLLILLLTLVPLTCAWAFLPGRHGMSPSAWSASALPSRLVAPTDTTDTTAVPSSASPQAFGSIDINPGLGSDTFLPDLPHDSLLPGHPRDTLIFEPLDRKGTVGTPSGAVAVSETGAATYTLDIEAPDGGALTPHIALAYDSQQGGYGLAGYGIGLTGFSAITRGGSDLFHDGAQRGVSHTAADNLFLDGKRLVFVSGTHGQDGATYVVEGDPYTRVVLHGDIGAGAPSSWFTVTTPAGMTWEYGRTPDSRLAYTNGRGQARVASWHVSKGTDRHAGTIAYTYATSGLCVRPVSVTYGTNEAQARGLIGKVAFAYRSLGANTRPFTLEDRHGQHDLCLSAVTTSLNDSVYRTYTLTYDESLDLSSGKWTRLTKVEEANGRGEQFPPVKLTWQPLPAFRPAATTLKVPGKDVDQSVTETGKRFLTADLNGDGVADIVRVSSASVPDTDKGGRSLFTRVYVSRSRVGATGEVTYDNLPLVYTLPPGFSAHGIRCLLSGASVMDFDGDGLNDLFFAFGTSSDGGRTSLTLPAGVKKDIKRAFTGDCNNDGLTDLILFYNGGYKVYFNRGGTAAADRFGEDSVACGTAIGDGWRMEQGDHDGATGNLLSRRRGDGAAETFGYDDLDRLVSVKQDGRETLRMTYAPNGNILSKTGVGAFSYDAEARPHAVTEVENADGSIPRSDLLTAFGDLNRIETVEDEGQGLKQTFAYGPDRQRWLSVLSRGGKEARRTVYAGAYERVTEGGHTREYYYLDGNILAIRENGTVNYYAAFTDRQGNILSVVDESGRKVFDATYDAWGRQTVRLNAIGLSRGYTGHEMMGEFGLINMNGRLYDPTLGRFLSPDNYVQEPDNSQSFNRYSYCLNNPLKYTDPSGELFGIDDLGIALAFAGLSAANSMISAAYSGKSVWKAGAFSLLTSAASYGVGAVFGQTGSFGHELLRAGAHGLADATLSALSGGEFFSSFISSAAASGIGSYAKGVKMSTGMMAISSAAMDGLVAWATGGDFLQEALNGFQIGLLNHAMHDGGFGITYYHDKDGNQCGTISEIVVTPTDKADLFAIAGTVNTVVGSVGSSLKNHGGNSTWGSNYKIYWHTQGRQGFYGNQYVTTTKLSAIGSRISNVAGPIGHALELYDFGKGIVLDYKAGYPNGYNTAIAAAGIACGYIGAKAGAALGAWFGGFGAIPGAIIGGAIGGVVGSFGGSMLGEQAIDYIYGR
mgnify:FL=1